MCSLAASRGDPPAAVSGLQSTCAAVVVQRRCCAAACGIYPDQGSNPCTLHWQVDSLLLGHKGISCFSFIRIFVIGFRTLLDSLGPSLHIMILKLITTAETSFLYEVLVLYWTGTWWSGVDDERVKEGKRLIFPGLRSWLLHSRESARKRERERERERERKTDRHGDQSSHGAKVF